VGLLRWRESFGPLLVWKGLAAAAVAASAALLAPRAHEAARHEVPLSALVGRAAAGWCDQYGSRGDLRVGVLDVRFHRDPKLFQEQEGIVVAPVGVQLVGAQKLLDVASHPPMLRRLEAEGTAIVAWEYAGAVNRDLRFVALSLVEPAPRETPRAGAPVRFDTLPLDVREEALATAADLEEHQLHTCKDFRSWALATAGPPPHTDQLLRLARWLGARIRPDRSRSDDLCAAIREERLTTHRAHVVAVMAAREAGVPAFAFATASPRARFLVGTYTDANGWALIDLERAADGFVEIADVLLTKLPLIGGFKASRHELWRPEAAAYTGTSWGVSAFSGTEWGRGGAGGQTTDTTEARTLTLSEVCS
jgi:hypothetical protein